MEATRVLGIPWTCRRRNDIRGYCGGNRPELNVVLPHGFADYSITGEETPNIVSTQSQHLEMDRGRVAYATYTQLYTLSPSLPASLLLCLSLPTSLSPYLPFSLPLSLPTPLSPCLSLSSCHPLSLPTFRLKASPPPRRNQNPEIHRLGRTGRDEIVAMGRV